MELEVLTIDQPDYFQGCSFPYIGVPVWKAMSKNDIIDSTVQELMECDFPLTDSDGKSLETTEEIRPLVEDYFVNTPEKPFIAQDDEWEAWLYIEIKPN